MVQGKVNSEVLAIQSRMSLKRLNRLLNDEIEAKDSDIERLCIGLRVSPQEFEDGLFGQHRAIAQSFRAYLNRNELYDPDFERELLSYALNASNLRWNADYEFSDRAIRKLIQEFDSETNSQKQ